MVIHELSHAYHHQVLGYGQPEIKAAYKRAVEKQVPTNPCSSMTAASAGLCAQ